MKIFEKNPQKFAARKIKFRKRLVLDTFTRKEESLLEVLPHGYRAAGDTSSSLDEGAFEDILCRIVREFPDLLVKRIRETSSPAIAFGIAQTPNPCPNFRMKLLFLVYLTLNQKKKHLPS